MARNLLIDAVHEEETRVVVLDGNKVEMFDFETSSKKQIVGNIYLARVARVEPALQAVFVEYGGNRHGFLAFSEIHPDYYHVPVSAREQGRAEAEKQAGESDAGLSSDFDPNSAKTDPESKPGANSQPAADASITGMEVIGPGQSPEDKENSARSEAQDQGVDAGDERAEPDGKASSVAEAAAAAPTSIKEENGRRPKNPRKFRIQEVIRARQILLVQVVKDERGSKGAALTTFISLAGRYCVLMPNTPRGGGISRKITSATDRKKLEGIASSFNLPDGAGLIIRTAGAKRTKQEIKRDYDFLLRQWDQVRQLTLKSIAPAPIYEEGGLIQRSVRDLYSKDIDTVIVQGAKGYRIAKDFMKLIMPSHAKKVQQYTESTPLFARFEVEPFLAGLYSSIAQLSSGGYIVINPTEALTAIDVNSGRATSHGSLEQTALQTNLEAAEEIARQLRLRDIAGLIVIDFIDMENRQHNSAVEKCLKEKTKLDRARVQVGRISNFGLLEMSRQRLRPGITEMTSTVCSECNGSGIIRSDESLALAVLRNIEAKCVQSKGGEILAKVPVRISNYIINRKRPTIDHIESAYGATIKVYGIPGNSSTDFSVERVKNELEAETDATDQIVSMETSLLSEPENEDSEAAESQRSASRRRRRRGGRKRSRGGAAAEQEAAPPQAKQASEANSDAKSRGSRKAAPSEAGNASANRPKKKTRGAGRQGKPEPAEISEDASTAHAGHSHDDKAVDHRRTDNRRDRDAKARSSEAQSEQHEIRLKSKSGSKALEVIDSETNPESPESPREYAAWEDEAPAASGTDDSSADFSDRRARAFERDAESAVEREAPLELVAQGNAEISDRSGSKAEISADDSRERNSGIRPEEGAKTSGTSGDGASATTKVDGWWNAA